MDVSVPASRSSPQLTARHSRRSFPNLTHLSLAPLSSRFPLDDDDGSALDDSNWASNEPPSQRQLNLQLHLPRSSYIQGKSAPTTPSILSRGASPSGAAGLRHSRSNRTRKRAANPTYIHDAALATSAPGPIQNKAKSTTVLHPPGHNPGLTASALRTPGANAATKAAMNPSAITTSADEWLHRAGITITTAAIETKGQSWLVSRASSTSLVHDGEDDTLGPSSNRHSYTGTADDEYSPVTPRHGGFGSRFGSRTASARNSRRGSRVGSRADVAGMGFTSLGSQTPGAAVQGQSHEGYFDDAVAEGQDIAVEPDFVDQKDVEEEEQYISEQLAEEEVKRLAADRGFGFGGLVDRLMGWPLFNVEEDGEDTDGNAEEEAPRKRREESERKAVTPKVEVPPPAPKSEGEGDGGEGGWKDAAWLLSVASKVIL
ncbi:hypothetical protein NA57DRAFT_74141 [Rhizodiscina lignyota]|uniref:Uncharacterized protein n=1 Tax=Rhizodiscina lignyota TaxID=1504668 RepID=A0A9P4IFD3_9PEZI|nr:hypothetical protein NA57DRAFT_74141 [Rhizodiscina lignyota]